MGSPESSQLRCDGRAVAARIRAQACSAVLRSVVCALREWPEQRFSAPIHPRANRCSATGVSAGRRRKLAWWSFLKHGFGEAANCKLERFSYTPHWFQVLKFGQHPLTIRLALDFDAARQRIAALFQNFKSRTILGGIRIWFCRPESSPVPRAPRRIISPAANPVHRGIQLPELRCGLLVGDWMVHWAFWSS